MREMFQHASAKITTRVLIFSENNRRNPTFGRSASGTQIPLCICTGGEKWRERDITRPCFSRRKNSARRWTTSIKRFSAWIKETVKICLPTGVTSRRSAAFSNDLNFRLLKWPKPPEVPDGGLFLRFSLFLPHFLSLFEERTGTHQQGNNNRHGRIFQSCQLIGKNNRAISFYKLQNIRMFKYWEKLNTQSFQRQAK